MVRPSPSSGRARRWLRSAELGGLLVAAYLPFLASSPGRLSPDTKVGLYLDPGRLLARAPYLWDAHVGAGTVPHQQVGYLFPMGPWFWLLDAVGVPDWVAQRLWWGTISVGAALGARWMLRELGLGRLGALAGAFVYLWAPYQLALTARMSVLLLPWAGLPWLVGLARRAVARGGWRDPAWFALLVLLIGGVNASSLLLVGLAPVAVVVAAGLLRPRAALAASARIGLLTVGVSLWWISALRLQGRHGLPVLQLTENLRTIAASSDPLDLLRGLGNWFLYGREQGRFTIDQAEGYRADALTRLASFGLPAAALGVATVLRWRYRTFAVLLLVGAVVVGVGAWPFSSPSLYGRLWKAATEGSSALLALRNTPRVAPVVVLVVATLLAAGVAAVRDVRGRAVAACAVVVVAGAALAPVWETGFLSDRVSMPETVPAYWQEAIAAMEAGGDATRVLEVPGSNFATYRWGNAIDPITPALLDRPYVAREVLPSGGPASADLLDAFDRRIQQGVLEPSTVAGVARLLRAGTVAVRSDLESERFGNVPAARLWTALTEPPPPGLGRPSGFGTGRPPPVALFAVDEPEPIVRAVPASGAVVVAGDGDGIVDAVAAGLVDGHGLLLSLPGLDDDDLRRAIAARGHVIVTDTYRRRPQHWFSSIRYTRGATERAGQTLPDRDGYDFRLDPFPGSGDDARTVVEHVGGTVDATADGGVPRPEDRAVHGFDGDLRSSWRVGGADPTGEVVTLRTDEPVRASELTLVQPQDGPRDRVLTSAILRFDGRDDLAVDLGPASLEPAGQRVDLGGARTFRRLDVELGATTVPPFEPALANAVGFAEVRVAGVVVDEVVRLPTNLPRRLAGAAPAVDVVLSRLRADPAQPEHGDEEPALDRRFRLGGAPRRFGTSGTVRLNPAAPDPVLDALLGTTTGGATFRSSGHLAGSPEARASSAFDTDPATAWTATAAAPEGQWLEVQLPAPVSIDRVGLTFLPDRPDRARPTRLRLEGDGGALAVLDVPDGAGSGVELSVPLLTSSRFRLVVLAATRAEAPVALADVSLAGVPVAATPAEVPGPCRDDLVEVDGEPLPVRFEGRTSEARRGLALAACDGRPLELDGGDHRLKVADGRDTGVDVDRLVLSSGAGGGPLPPGVRTSARGGASVVRVDGRRPDRFQVRVESDGEPFWLVLGQSRSDGWIAEVHDDAAEVGPNQLVDGYANGWLVRPDRAGTLAMSVCWQPQRQMWAAYGASALAVTACLAIVGIGRRRRDTHDVDEPAPSFARPARTATGRSLARRTVTVLAMFTFVAGPGPAVAGALATLVPGRFRALLVPLPPALVAVAVVADRPALAWFALAVVVGLVASEPAPQPAPQPAAAATSTTS